MSDFSTSLFSQLNSFVFGDTVEVQRNPHLRLQDEYTTEIKDDTKIRYQEGSKPAQEITVKEFIGSPDKDTKYQGLGDPSTRLKNLLTNHQYRHASNDAKTNDQGSIVEPNGAAVVPLQRPKVSVDVERSKVRQGDTALQADNGAVLVPTGDEHR